MNQDSYYGPAWAEISLDHLRENFRLIRRVIGPSVRLCAVVKANAYGHGAVQIAKAAQQEGADALAVATWTEALELRASGCQLPILCLGFMPDAAIEAMIRHEIEMSVSTLEKGRVIAAVAHRLGSQARLHVKIDTGMSRLGFAVTPDAADQIAALFEDAHLTCAGLFSHFAKADQTDPAPSHVQADLFETMQGYLSQRGIKPVLRHLCNSAGLLRFPQYHYDMVRAGIVLYGCLPWEAGAFQEPGFRPVMGLYSTVSLVKDLAAGRSVSYGGTYTVEKDKERIATLTIGYADGFTRLLSNRATVGIGGQPWPIVGNICMDQAMAQVDDSVREGDRVTIFSDQPGFLVERLAKSLGTINYELLCMVNRRVPRVYIESGQVRAVDDALLP